MKPDVNGSVVAMKSLVKIVFDVVLGAVVLLLGACKDADEADMPRAIKLYDVVEVASKSAQSAVFTLWRPDAVEPVTLYADNVPFDLSGVEAGECVFLGYTPVDGMAYTSGRVIVEACGSVNNSRLGKSSPEKLEGWDADPVYLMSLWRAGNKICVRVRLTYDTNPRLFALVADETTADDPYPTAYLYHRRRNDTPNFSRQYYAAFDVSALWATPGCQGLKVRVCNSNIPDMNEFVVRNPLAGQSATD